MNVAGWVPWLLTALVAGGLVFAVARRFTLRPWRRFVWSFLGASVAFAVVSLVSMEARPSEVTVTILQPPNGARVEGSRLRVSGVVQPPGALVTLVVRSETDDRWWVQDVVRADARSGEWSIEAFVGTPTEGRGKRFTILALASADSALFHVFTGRLMARGMSPHSVPLWNRSPLHVVWRAD